MAREHLESRIPWQIGSAARGEGPEKTLKTIMSLHLRHKHDGVFRYEHKPKVLRGIYGTRTDKQGRTSQHGIEPEGMIINQDNGKAVFVEMKRQRPAGNAHERACKYMMPGIIASMQEAACQPSEVIPMWWIFTNGIAKDPWRRQEIGHWFKGLERQLMFWPDWSDYDSLIHRFEEDIKGMLL